MSAEWVCKFTCDLCGMVAHVPEMDKSHSTVAPPGWKYLAQNRQHLCGSCVRQIDLSPVRRSAYESLEAQS